MKLFVAYLSSLLPTAERERLLHTDVIDGDRSALLYKEHMYTKECGRKQKQTEITQSCYDHAASTFSKNLCQRGLSWNVLNVNRARLRVYRRLKKNHNHWTYTRTHRLQNRIVSWGSYVLHLREDSNTHVTIFTSRRHRLPCANSVYSDAPPPFLTLVPGTRL